MARLPQGCARSRRRPGGFGGAPSAQRKRGADCLQGAAQRAQTAICDMWSEVVKGGPAPRVDRDGTWRRSWQPAARFQAGMTAGGASGRASGAAAGHQHGDGGSRESITGDNVYCPGVYEQRRVALSRCRRERGTRYGFHRAGELASGPHLDHSRRGTWAY